MDLLETEIPRQRATATEGPKDKAGRALIPRWWPTESELQDFSAAVSPLGPRGPNLVPAYSVASGGVDSSAAPARSADAADGSALPCHTGDNCNGRGKTRGSEVDSSHLKAAAALEMNVCAMVREWGLEQLGFLTLTFRDHILDLREAQRRFHSLLSGVLGGRYEGGITVVERQRSGRIHFHVLVALRDDIRTGFDFAAVKAGDYRSACPELREEWRFWREVADRYGFGRTELLPVRSGAAAISRYLGKYLGKHLGARVPEDKGARLVRYWGGTRCCGCRFSWNGPASWLFRERVRLFAKGQNCLSYADLCVWGKNKYGSHWFYRVRDDIAHVEVTHYPTVLVARRDGIQFPDGTSDSEGPIDVRRPDGWREQADDEARRMWARECEAVPSIVTALLRCPDVASTVQVCLAERARLRAGAVPGDLGYGAVRLSVGPGGLHPVSAERVA